ncbi:MAG TPA: hypothetical protein VIR33_14250 [Thermopolyspora sp.]|jgi:hypothetical protein
MPKPTVSPPPLAELKARILAGDQTVTAEQLAQATALAELDELRAEADRQRAEQQAAAERHQRIRAAVDTLLGVIEDADTTALADAMIREGVRRRVDHYNRQAGAFGETTAILTQGGVQMQRLTPGVRNRGNAAQIAPDAGVIWKDAWMGLPQRLVIDGRDIFPVNPSRAIADAIADGLRDAGQSYRLLAPNVTIRPEQRRPAPKMDSAAAEQMRTWIAEQEATR